MKSLALALLLVILAVPTGRPYVEDAGTSLETTQAGSYGPVTLSGVSEPSAVPLPLAAPVQLDDGGGVSSAMEGWATFCRPTPTRCRSWGHGAKVGAVPSFRYGDTPYRVTVWSGRRHTSVLVVSFCACGDRAGRPTVIDLSPAAFDDLAQLSAGVIPVVVVSGGGPSQTLPPTDTP